MIARTDLRQPQDVNNPDYSASETSNGDKVLFDSSPSLAAGDCSRNPASPSCTWHERKRAICYPFPKNKGDHTSWYGVSASLKVVVVAKGGGSGGH